MPTPYVMRLVQVTVISILLLLTIQFGLLASGPNGSPVHAMQALDEAPNDAGEVPAGENPQEENPEEEDVVAQNTSLWYTPHELDFGAVGVDILSARHVVTITNVGATVIDFAGGTAPDPFSASNNCSGSLNPGASCNYFYRFRPPETGSFSATTGPGTDAGPVVVTLRGVGVGPQFTYTPLSIDFGPVASGTTAGPRTVTVRNTGLATISFTGGDAQAPFSVSENCPPLLEPGQSCEFEYSFSPSEDGTFTTITGPISGGGTRMEVQLRGQGVSGDFPADSIVASPLALDFGPVGVGQTSDPQVVTIRNTSPSTNLSNISGGDVGAPFSVNKECAGDVAPGESCTYTFRFSPTSTGVFSATSNTSTSFDPFAVLLHGTGVGAQKTVSPLSLDFGPVPLNTTGASQQVVIRNSGQTALTGFSGGGVSPPFAVVQDCAESLSPGDSCTYTFEFTPTAAGIFTETSTTSSDAGPFTIQLSGGMAPPMIGARFRPRTIERNGTSTLELTITNPNPNLALTNVSFDNDLPPGLLVASANNANSTDACGTPTFSPMADETSFGFSGGTIEGGTSCVVTVDVTTPASGTYVNTTNRVEAGNPAGTGNMATARLTVSHERYLPKVHK